MIGGTVTSSWIVPLTSRAGLLDEEVGGRKPSSTWLTEPPGAPDALTSRKEGFRSSASSQLTMLLVRLLRVLLLDIAIGFLNGLCRLPPAAYPERALFKSVTLMVESLLDVVGIRAGEPLTLGLLA